MKGKLRAAGLGWKVVELKRVREETPAPARTASMCSSPQRKGKAARPMARPNGGWMTTTDLMLI